MDLQQEWCAQAAKDAENDRRHRPLEEENAFWHAVRTGDLDYVRQNCRQQRFVETEGVGVLSKDGLQNMKFHFVVTAAMVTRLCVESGMEMEQAFRMCDFYILKLDQSHTVREIVALHDQMVLDFTEKMQILVQYAGVSKPVKNSIEYIYVHIQERITVDQLAVYTELSPGHLSRLFKKETGISISDYIRKKKIEKAQELLKFCDYSLVEISNYLSFSSQSHFTQLFHELTGMTPKKYRDCHRGNWGRANGPRC